MIYENNKGAGARNVDADPAKLIRLPTAARLLSEQRWGNRSAVDPNL